MTYYIAEIRFNRKNAKSKRKSRMRKRKIIHLLTLALASILVFISFLTVPTALSSNQSDVLESLEELSAVISDLPDDAFKNPESADGHRGALCNKINAVINQIEAGANEGAVNKLINDIEKTIWNWIEKEWVEDLIEKVEDIIEKIINIDKKPPLIIDVWRYPENPEYDEYVTVIAHIVSKKSAVESVILSYSHDSANWINVTMNLVDGLYVAEIPPLPYNTTVHYKVYAHDLAGNLKVSDTYSYVVTDSHPPIISYVDHVPPSPSHNEVVTVFANVTEPSEASGVESVTLRYRTEDDWKAEEMTLDNELYARIIPGFPNGSVVQFKIHALDYAGNPFTSGIYSYTVGEAEVPPNIPPTAKFTESAKIVYTGEPISFNASESYDPDGVIVSYFWDLGEGTNATDVLMEHAYLDDGNYAVILTVTDDDGATATAISIQTVLNRAPFASFTENTTMVLTNEVIHFDASDSEDLDGSIIVYIWDFGDGTKATGVMANHAYDDDDVYTVTLTVIDDDGTISSTSAVMTVSNRPPIALFTENVTVAKKDEAIGFDASESYDPDGFIINYFWDFGDGTNATGVTVEHAYTDDGNFTVTLAVTDDDEASSSKSTTKLVETLAEFPLAWLAAIALGVAALTGAVIYALYRRRKKKSTGSTMNPENKPIVSFYVPSKILHRDEQNPERNQ